MLTNIPLTWHLVYPELYYTVSQSIRHKHSSTPGDRPSRKQLAAGEIGINNSATDPGMFMTLANKSVVKVGPVAMGQKPPKTSLQTAGGELWFNSSTQDLNIWEQTSQTWLTSSYRDAYTVVVDSASPRASDSPFNTGTNLPFQTLNRACIEVARRTIFENQEQDFEQNKFVILLKSSEISALNDPGISFTELQNSISPFISTSSFTPDLLRKFNVARSGGIVLPRGVTVIASNPYKTTLRPTYVPAWTADEYAEAKTPDTSLLKWTSGCVLSHLVFQDKRTSNIISNITGDPTEPATFHTLIPHNYSSEPADQVRLTYFNNISQNYNGQPVLPNGTTFLVQPLSTLSFQLLKSEDDTLALRREFPSDSEPGSLPPKFLKLSKINFSTHHKTYVATDITETDLTQFYNKVQYVYAATEFQDKINQSEVTAQELDPSISCHVDNINLTSEWGLNGIYSSKHLEVNGYNHSVRQNDPEVYEVYQDTDWKSLKELYAVSNGISINAINNDGTEKIKIIQYLKENFSEQLQRLFYRYLDSISGKIDPLSDTRFYALIAEGTGKADVHRFMSGENNESLCVFAKDGGQITLSNSKLKRARAVGYFATPRSESIGFNIVGLRRPLKIPVSELERPSNFEKFYLNNSIKEIQDEKIILHKETSQKNWKPYVLTNGVAIYADSYDTGIPLRAFTGNISNPNSGITELPVNPTTNDFKSVNPKNYPLLGPLYLRRFIDPRPLINRHYYFHITSSADDNQPPKIGDILQLRFSSILNPGKQLSASESGGWNHMFYVTDVLSKAKIDLGNPQYERTNTSNHDYYISLGLLDSSLPWFAEGKLQFKGSSFTYKNRLYTNTQQVFSQTQLDPDIWRQSVSIKNFQRFRQGLPENSGWGANPSFARGVAPSLEDYRSKVIIERDPEEASKGGSDKPVVAEIPFRSDSIHNTKATRRFFNIMGYSGGTPAEPTSKLTKLLEFRFQYEQNVSWAESSSSSELLGDPQGGFLTALGPIPVAFHRNSTVEYNGKQEFESHELWGGRIISAND